MNTNIKLTDVSYPRIGIAFGGGGARGFAHINVIAAMDELGIKPSLITGTSIGSIIGAAYAAGMSAIEIEEFAIGAFSSKRSLYSRIWKTRSGNLTDMVSKGPQSIMKFNVERLLRDFIPNSVPVRFDQLKIPLKVIATDFFNECDHVMETGELLTALAASSCIPTLFAPVVRDQRTLIDGGTTNPVPFEYLNDEVDIKIGVDVIGTTKTLHPDNSTIDATYGSSQIFQKTIVDLKMALHKPHIILKPDVSQFWTMEFTKAREIIEVTSDIKDDLKRKIDKLFSDFYDKNQLSPQIIIVK
jgi:NTE family protein